MARVFLSLGSNLGDRRRHLDAALALLRAEEAVRVITCSQVYETTPWPEPGWRRARTWHLNCAVEIETELAATAALPPSSPGHRGRNRAGRGRLSPARAGRARSTSTSCSTRTRSSRRIGSRSPHRSSPRRFVLVPLADIAPEVEHPTLYQSIADLLGEFPGEGDVLPFPTARPPAGGGLC